MAASVDAAGVVAIASNSREIREIFIWGIWLASRRTESEMVYPM